MEILRQLTEKQILDIREHFVRAKEHSLTPLEFEAVMHDACRMANIQTDFRLLELFNEVDVNGDGTMSWDEFTMFLISCSDPTVPKAAIGTSLDDGMVTRYALAHHAPLDVPRSVTQMQFFPRLNRLLRRSRTERSGTRIKLCNNNDGLTEIAEIALPDEVGGLCCEYVPPVFGRVASSSIAVACNDCTLRFYDAGKSVLGNPSDRIEAIDLHTTHPAQPLKAIRTTKLLESQTVIRWSNSFERMILGSRTGVVSVLDVDSPTVFSHEKIHALLVADMFVSDDLLFTASVDPVNAVKCIDLQRSVVKYAIRDHVQGATLLGVNSRTQQLFSVGFDTVVLAHAIAMPKVRPFKLIDLTRPHRGRINCLEVIEGTPQVITADTEGLIKVWDIRMNHCVQNISPRQEEVVCEGFVHGITAMAFLASTRRLVACGREMCLYNYDAATNPHLADDRPAGCVLYNTATHTLLTIHDRTAKLWEASTGMLRSWFKDLFPHEVTATCFVLPHERSFVVGTFHGDLFVYAYVLGTPQRKLRPHCRLPHSEVVQILYMEQFREYCNGYVVSAFKHEIVIVPDASDERSPFHIRTLDSVLETTLVKSITLCRGGFLAVGTADGHARLVDLQTFNVMWAWGEGHLKGDVLSIVSMPLVSALSGMIYFLSDSCGNLACAASARPNAVIWMGTWQAAAKRDFSSPSEQPLQTSLSGAQQTSLSISMSTALPPLPIGRNSTTRTASRVPSAQVLFGSNARPNSAVAAYFSKTQKDEIYCVIATHLQVLPGSRFLVVADERGTVTVWNVQEYVVAAMGLAALEQQGISSPINSPLTPTPHTNQVLAIDSTASLPRIHAQWKAHEDELTSMCTFLHDASAADLTVSGRNGAHGGSKSRHVVIATSSLDREVRLWSTDGVCLGNVSHERIQGRDLSAGMLPFVLDSPHTDSWQLTDVHLQEAEREYQDSVASVDASMSHKHRARRRVSNARLKIGDIDRAENGEDAVSVSMNNAGEGSELQEIAISQVLEQSTNAPAHSDSITAVEEARHADPPRVLTAAAPECLTFLTAVSAEAAFSSTRPGGDDELVQRTQTAPTSGAAGQLRLDSRALRNRFRGGHNSTSCVRLGLVASPPQEPRPRSPLSGTSPGLIEECFSQIRHGDGPKRPDVELLLELTPRGDNPTDLVKDGRLPRKPGPQPLWLSGIRREEECREAKIVLKKLTAHAKSIGTEGERALTLSGRVVVPPAQSGAPPSARSLRWKSLT